MLRIIILGFLLLFFGTANAQYSEEDVSNKIKALKKELEEQKRLRDRIIAKRWDDKKKYNDGREAFNEKYDDLKEKLELKSTELERAQEEVEALQKDEETLKSQLEAERAQFLGLSYMQRNNIRQYTNTLTGRFPSKVPERQAVLNRLLKSADNKKDNPAEVLSEIVQFYKSEIDLTREITLDEQELILADQNPGQGHLLRIGMVAKAYRDKTGRTAIMLRTANAKGRLYEWREDLTSKAKESLNLQMSALVKADAATQPKVSVLPMDILRTRAVGMGYTQGEKDTFSGQAKSYFKAGGIWMYPLAAIAIAALLLLIERFIFWFWKNKGSGKLYNRVLAHISKQEFEKAVKLCDSNRRSAVMSAISNVLGNKDKDRDTAEKELQAVLLKETPALERRLATISVLGAAAPLLGLLGTVAGMIELFESITLYGTSDPKLMASGISIALITTQTGLAVSVPIMIAHNFIANRVDGLTTKIQHYSLTTLNLVWPKG